MALAEVPCGPFVGWTAAEITTRLATLKAFMIARTPGEGQITSASVNGSAFTYDPRGGMTVAEEIAALQEARAWVDDTALVVPTEQVFAAR